MRSLLVLTGLALAAAPLPGAEPVAPVAGLPLPAGAVRRFGDDRFRIAGAPLASALSPDGTRLAVLSFVRRRSQVLVTVFDADTGRPVCRGSVESADVFTTGRLAFSPDGKYVAAAIAPDVRVVWASHTGELVTKLPPSAFGPGLCQFTPEGLLAVTDRDRTDLYEVPSGKVVKTWPVGRIARLTADARTFARVEEKGDAISIGDPATGAVAGTRAVKTTVDGLAFSADGKMLAVVHDLERLETWDTGTRKQLGQAKLPPFTFDFDDVYHAVSFSPDGRTIVLETRGGEIRRWDTHSLESLPALQAPKLSLTAYSRGVHWSKDGRTILAAVSGVHLSKDGQCILGIATDGLVARWDAKTGKELSEDDSSSRLCFAVTPSGSELIVGHLTGQIEVWDVATGRVVRRLAQGHDEGPALVCLALSPDGRRVAVGEGHCHIRVFRTAGGVDARRIMCPFRMDGGWMKSVAWAPDGKSLFADGSGMIVCRVNLADGETVWAVNDENMPCFAPTPDGRYVVKALWDSIQFLDASTGKECSTVRLAMAEKQGPVGPLAWVPDGKRLALGIGGGTVVVCDRAGRELRRFAASEQGRSSTKAASALGRRVPHDEDYRVGALAFSPDGKWIVSGSGDLSVRVWETATGRLVVRFDGHDEPVEQVAVAPDGRSAFSAGGDGLVYQWDLTPRPYSRARQRPDDLWAAAAEAEPAFAVPAAWTLITGPDESRAFVADRLPPFAAATPEQVAKWLEDLDAPAFADREAATQALRAQGPLVERQLRETLQTTASPEVRRRAEDLLDRLENTSTADGLRALRLVQACELSGTPAARALLQRWAGGAPGAVLTEDAKAALARLDHRPR